MSNVTIEDFSRLVSGIYAAAVTPSHWEVAIREIHRTLDGSAGALLMADGPIWSIQNAILPVGAAKSYAEHYSLVDCVLAAVQKGPVAAVRTGTELIIPFQKSEFYTDWLRPFELEDGLYARLTGGPHPMCFLVGAPRRSEAFDSAERVKLMGGLVPHLQQAMRTQGKLATLSHGNADLAAALEAVRHGTIIVGSDGWVINLNTAAERVLRAEDGLKMWSGRLAVTSTTAEHQLQRALHAALTDDGSTIRRGRSFLCQRSSGNRPYVIHVLPLHRAAADEISSEKRALVLIVDPEQEPEPAAALLRRLYGLTTTGADVAVHVARGTDLKEISDELSVSITTVRKHLQHVFVKTDTHRQAELVRLLLTLRP
jgi:DNA-binding CsgD family transcriptional regulator/PAS domain-containing protein